MTRVGVLLLAVAAIVAAVLGGPRLLALSERHGDVAGDAGIGPDAPSLLVQAPESPEGAPDPDETGTGAAKKVPVEKILTPVAVKAKKVPVVKLKKPGGKAVV